jgi:DNA-binding CsgD family transcriptional regulator
MDQLYDSVADLDRWPAFLASATDLFAARGAQVGHTDLANGRLSFSVVHGYDWSATHMQNYERLMSEDPRIPYFSANPFRPVHCRMSLTDEQLHESRVYREVLAVGGVEYSLGVNLVEDTRTLTYFLVLRDRSQPPFDDADCELMGTLVPHLRRALKLQRDLARIASERTAALDALDDMTVGIVIVDCDARIRIANETARRIARSCDGLRFADEHLVIDGCGGDSIRTRASRLLRSALSGIPSPGEAFQIVRPSGAEGYKALISCLGGNDARFGWSVREEALAIVYIRDPEQPDESRAELLQRLYGLMPSQARPADLLATGCSLKQAAKQLNITPASARHYLKLIFQKTGTHRQTELVRKVLLVPAPRSNANGPPDRAYSPADFPTADPALRIPVRT